MATIYTSVDVDVDIEIDEFVDSCSDREIQRLIKYLSNEGHFGASVKSKYIDPTKMTANELEFVDMLSILSDKYHQMDVTEINMIEELYKKYK